jgi:hypothetical protein
MPQKKELIYPIFLECINYAKDPFWEILFEELAYGQPPHGTYISKGFICCSYKGKEFGYKIERKDAQLIYDELTDLLSNKLGLLSYKEKAKEKIVFAEIERTIKESQQDWAAIRRKNVKDTLYERFVIDMKREHNLTIKQCKYLLAVIVISIAFKTITSRDIVYSGDKIENIQGIEFEDNEIKITRSLFPTVSETDSESDDNVLTKFDNKRLADEWSKYIKVIRENVPVIEND